MGACRGSVGRLLHLQEPNGASKLHGCLPMCPHGQVPALEVHEGCSCAASQAALPGFAALRCHGVCQVLYQVLRHGLCQVLCQVLRACLARAGADSGSVRGLPPRCQGPFRCHHVVAAWPFRCRYLFHGWWPCLMHGATFPFRLDSQRSLNPKNLGPLGPETPCAAAPSRP